MAASADAFEIDGIYYKFTSEPGKVEVTSNPQKYTGSVVIPATFTYNDAKYSVTSIGYRAFYECRGLTSITIPNSVTSIGEWAFSGCSGMTSVTIGNSVTSIDGCAFQYCSGLTSVHITDIASWCKMSFFDFDSNPLYYAHHLYIGAEEIKDLVIPNSVTTIGDYAFESCSGLTSVTIGNRVATIEDYAFSGCRGVTTVTIPNSVTTIGRSAFSGCTGLTSITIPNSVTTIGRSAFYECSGSENIDVEQGNTLYESRDNCNAII